MKVMILGANGMAGHVLLDYFRDLTGYNTVYTSRDPSDRAAMRLDALNFADAEQLIRQVKPDIIINAIGILNQQAEDHLDVAEAVNGRFPHHVAGILDELDYGGKLVHISTDCVFSGEVQEGELRDGWRSRGRYEESDPPDGTSVYARTKAAGEVIYGRHLTVRTSIVGPEIRQGGIGLMGWFMRQRGRIQGYTKVLWNGVTTLQLAKAIEQMIRHDVRGLVHLTAPEIVSKHELLQMFAEQFDKQDVIIEPVDEPRLDRTLASTRTDYIETVPNYRVMLAELHDWMRSS